MITKISNFITRPNLLQRIKKKIIYRFISDQWIILVAQSTAGYKGLQWQDFRPILPPPDRDWADPFPWVHNGRRYLFIEEKLYSSNLGRIVCLSLDESLNITSHQVILEKPYHLSYPFLFEYQEQLYMVPESRAGRTVDLYRCVSFPDQWEFCMTLLADIEAVDSTLVEKNGRWWLFANVREGEGSSWDTLQLYSSDTPLSSRWTPHPGNPIVKDVSTARPAGRFQFSDGELIRPSQDCSVRYGYATNFNRVTVLDEKEYKEILISKFLPPGQTQYQATHTWNEMNGLVAVDAIFRRRK